MAHRVFISRSAKSKTTANAVCATLRLQDIRCRIAQRSVFPGIERGKCVIEGLAQGRIAVLLCAFAVLLGAGHAQMTKGLQPEPAEGGRRLALVVGNKDYLWKPLANPVNDATDVATALSRDGFNGGTVRPMFNLKEHDFKRAVREFVESVKPGDFAFFYYSGHGVEVKGTNYLLPVDLPAEATEGEVEDEAVSAQRIAGDLEGQGAAVKVLVLDACRDNPLRAARSMGGGLAPMEGLGSLIVFATEAGRTASDNTEGRNGLFTQYLLRALAREGVSLDDAVRDVARQMAAETNRRQVPAIYGLLEEPVFLASGPATVNVTPVQPAPDPCLEAWDAIKDSRSPQDYEDFTAACPQSLYTTAAKLAANKLRRENASANLTPAKFPATNTTADDVPHGSIGIQFHKDQNLPDAVRNDADIKNGIAVESVIGGGPADKAGIKSGDIIFAIDGRDISGGDELTQTIAERQPGSEIHIEYWRDGARIEANLILAERNQLYPGITAYFKGQSYYNQKDYAKAMPEYRQACDEGDKDGCVSLGLMYENGDGVSQEYGKPLALYGQACDAGNAWGCYNLGSLYENAHGVTKDYSKALTLYKQACDGGEMDSCFSLGYMYENSEGVSQDDAKARELYKQACDGGSMSGCNDLGVLYGGGHGVTQDLAQAAMLYQKACNGGIVDACGNLGYYYANGFGVAKNVQKGKEMLQQACNGGNQWSCDHLKELQK